MQQEKGDEQNPRRNGNGMEDALENDDEQAAQVGALDNLRVNEIFARK